MIEDLETERLRLRPLTARDVDLLVELDGDPAVMRFINGGKPSTREEVERIVQQFLGHRWLAYDKASDEFVGWFAIRPSGPKSRELGYRLRREMWGKGLATEGSQALIELAFTQLGVDRVRAETMAVNTASRRVMERCGLRYVRTFQLEWDDPIDGSEQGEVEYEITRADWGKTSG